VNRLLECQLARHVPYLFVTVFVDLLIVFQAMPAVHHHQHDANSCHCCDVFCESTKGHLHGANIILPRTTASVVTPYCHRATSKGSSGGLAQTLLRQLYWTSTSASKGWQKKRRRAPIGSPDDIGIVAQPIAVARTLASSYRRKAVLFDNCHAQLCSEIPSPTRLYQDMC
jgi:hypothetical protein